MTTLNLIFQKAGDGLYRDRGYGRNGVEQGKGVNGLETFPILRLLLAGTNT